MRSTHSFATDFIIRKCKGDKTKAMIFARITVDGSSREISIKEKINHEDWDNKGEIVKGKSPTVKGINKAIDDIRFRIKEKYRMLEDAGALITAEIIKDAYLGIHTLQKGHKLIELTDYYKKIWEPKLKNGGFKNYKTTVEYIKHFLASKYAGGDIYLSQLTMQTAT